MASGANVWVSRDLSEQISDFNGEFVLITTNANMRKTVLGKTLEEAIEKLKELGRYDIVAELK